MDAATLYGILKTAQEPKGYIFNHDKEKVFELLEGLKIYPLGS